MSDVHKYDNPVQPDNKFGHALELLDRHLPTDAAGAVHLDIACGFGHIAEPLTERHGVHYVGVDVDRESLADLESRGFEAHFADLSTEDATEALTKILDGRRLASVTFLDGLEHMTDGAFALAAIGRLLAADNTVAVLSVPNVTHIDIGIKTLLGQWEYTEAGLLDRTHYQLFSADGLRRALRRAGLQPIDEFDVRLARSDQHFPADHLALSDSTTIGQWLRATRDQAEPHSITNQFVWAMTSVPPRDLAPSEQEAPAPFLTVMMRTQGRRPQEFREALLCLAGQSSQDFEVIVVAHKTNLEEQKLVERVIEDQPPSLRSKIRLVLLDHGRRSTPLNHALRLARGRYVAIFDDDDIVLANWVSSFAAAAEENPGTILRGVTLRQEATVASVRAVPGVKATGAPAKVWTQEFSLTEHLAANQSPPIGWVFPRSLYTDFGLQFEESMTTTEDWEFLLRGAEIAGVTDIKRVMAIYHWWPDRASSRTAHSQDEWAQNQREIERRIDSKPLLLPVGETRKLRQELLRLKELERQTRAQRRELSQARAKIGRLEGRLSRARNTRDRVARQLRRERSATARLRRAKTPETFSQRLRRSLRPRTRLKRLVGR